MLDREKTRQAVLLTEHNYDHHVRVLREVARAFVEGRLIDRDSDTVEWRCFTHQGTALCRQGYVERLPECGWYTVGERIGEALGENQ